MSRPPLSSDPRVATALVIALVLTGVGFVTASIWRGRPEAPTPAVSPAAPETPKAAPSPAPVAKAEAPKTPPRPGAAPAPKGALVNPITRKRALAADLSLHEAMYWRARPDGLVACDLCPRRCVLRETERGACKARVNFGGKLYTLVYGKPVAVHMDPVEKKPVFHFLPGTSILSIATAGCNLACRFCQNWSISQAFPERARHYNLSPAEVVALARRRNAPSIAYTYTEPSIFYEYVLDTAKRAKREGIRNVLVTCGYLNEKPLRELAKHVDAANVDLKGFSEAFYRKYCDARLQPVLDALKVLKEEGVLVEVTNLIIPGGNDDPKMIRDMCKWIVKELGPETPLHFSRYHPDYKMERPGPTPVATLEKARRIAKEVGLKHVYVGNVYVAGGGDTYCPKCGKLLIRRRGYWVRENHVVKGKCKFCGAKIEGVFPGAEPKRKETGGAVK